MVTNNYGTDRYAALQATKRFKRGTIGHGVYYGIADLYYGGFVLDGLFNNYSARIGEFFQQPEIQKLMEEPISNREANLKVATEEFNYWQSVRDNPYSSDNDKEGATLALKFSPEVRAQLQTYYANGLIGRLQAKYLAMTTLGLETGLYISGNILDKIFYPFTISEAYCFIAGTPILMSDGTYKPIEEIRIDDEVMAFEGLGKLRPRKVIQTFIKVNQEVVEVGNIKVTLGHSFLQPDGSFKPLAEIDTNGYLVGVTGKRIPHPGVKPVAGKHTVYNFAVEELHTYVAGEYRVHNESLSLYKPVTTAGSLGSAIGGQIATYFADDTFASQLLSKSIGSTVIGWVGDAIAYEFIFDNKSLEVLALPNRLASNLVTTATSLGSDELAQSLIDVLNLDSPLEQIFASTLVSELASYSIATIATESLGGLTAVKYFGASPLYLQDLRGNYILNSKGEKIISGADLSLETFSANLLNAFGGAVGSYAGRELSDKLLNTSSREAQFGGSLGSTIGSIVGQTLIPIPGIGGAIGAALGNLYGSFIGYLMDEVPVLGYLIAPGFGLLIELLDSVIDEDFPRAAYIVNIDNGEFATQFAYELDDGNTEIARQMGEAARDILNFFASTVGGQLLTVENAYYGHYKEQLVYQLEDDAPGRSSFGTRVGFGDNAQAAIEAGVVYQLTKTQIEGGDRYIKRFFNNYTNSRSNLEDFNELLQLVKEYGTYQDNPALYQEYVNQLAENSIQDADKRILDLRSQPWNSFVPPELNEELIKKVDANVDTNLLPIVFPISIEGDDLIINGERIIDWLKTQPGNKIQFLQFNDGSLYTINIEEKYQDLDDILGNGIPENLDFSNLPKVKHATLKLYEKDPTIKDFGLDVLPSQVSLSLSGNNLIINGELIADWLTNTNNRLETLRFADGSRFKIVVENNSTVKLENELVANFNTVLAKAIEFNLSTPQSSDNYKGNNVTKIIYGNGGVVQGNDNSDDVLISSSNAETLQGGKGDDVYRYSLGSGKDRIEDIGGMDVIEFDSNIQLSNLQLQESGNNLIINIINPSNPSAPITDQLTINNFVTNKIELIRLGNNEEYLFDNSNGQWQLKAANSIQTFTSNNITVQGTIGADVIRGSGEKDTLSGGAGNDTYLYSFGDGLNTTIYDTGDYEGKVR